MDTGQIVSATAHAAVIVWVMVGGFFSTPPDAPSVAVTEVSLMTSDEFAAMVAAAPVPSDALAPEAQSEIAAPQPVDPATEPAETPAPESSPLPAPRPEPEPAPEADANPDVSEIAPVAQPDIAEAPAAPVAEIEQPLPVETPDEEAKPNDAPRVAPIPAEAPEPDAEVAEVPTPAVTPDQTPEAPVVEEERAEAAPEEATTQIITEAVETDETPTLAPTSSLRPRTKPPARTADTPVEAEAPAEEIAAAEPPAAVETATDEEAAAEATDDVIADAVAAAVAEADTADASGGQGTAPSGPPMTSGDKDALRVAVEACWNVGSLSSDAIRVKVVVGVDMQPDGTPNVGSIRMVGFSDGSEASANQAYEAARRAIIICGARGFPLPPEKYDQWKTLELNFDPSGAWLR